MCHVALLVSSLRERADAGLRGVALDMDINLSRQIPSQNIVFGCKAKLFTM
jgi:hypothetical protein